MRSSFLSVPSGMPTVSHRSDHRASPVDCKLHHYRMFGSLVYKHQRVTARQHAMNAEQITIVAIQFFQLADDVINSRSQFHNHSFSQRLDFAPLSPVAEGAPYDGGTRRVGDQAVDIPCGKLGQAREWQ